MLHHLGCGQLVLSINIFNNEIIMNKLEKKEGVYYTQNIENLPIEERVFFREGKGISATSENYRVTTQVELDAWKEYKEQQDKMLE